MYVCMYACIIMYVSNMFFINFHRHQPHHTLEPLTNTAARKRRARAFSLLVLSSRPQPASDVMRPSLYSRSATESPSPSPSPPPPPMPPIPFLPPLKLLPVDARDCAASELIKKNVGVRRSRRRVTSVYAPLLGRARPRKWGPARRHRLVRRRNP